MPLVKTIPELSSQPFKAVNAIGTVNTPAQGRYIQYNDHEQDDDKCHHMPSFGPSREKDACTYINSATINSIYFRAYYYILYSNI